MGTQRQTPSLRQPKQIIGLGRVSKRLNESRKRGRAVLDARSCFCRLSCPPLVCGKCKEEDDEFRGWASMRRTIKKMQVVVMATQGFSSAAEAVSFPARRTGSYFTPLSLVQSDITSDRHASCCHSEQAYKANHQLSRNNVQLPVRLLTSPVLQFPTTRHRSVK